MTNIAYRTIGDGVAFRSIPDCKFKTMRISMHLFLPLCWETAAANALLPFLLSRTSREYPDYTKLGEHLAGSVRRGTACRRSEGRGHAGAVYFCFGDFRPVCPERRTHFRRARKKLLCSVWFDPLLMRTDNFRRTDFSLKNGRRWR